MTTGPEADVLRADDNRFEAMRKRATGTPSMPRSPTT